MRTLGDVIMALLDKVKAVVTYLINERVRLLDELATAKEDLAIAIADDAADEAAIVEAQVKADVAQQQYQDALKKLEAAEAEVAADKAEDSQIEALLSTVEVPL